VDLAVLDEVRSTLGGLYLSYVAGRGGMDDRHEECGRVALS
jgi:hypothetical protein